MTERSTLPNSNNDTNTSHKGSEPVDSNPLDSGAGIDELAERLRSAENVDPDLATIIADNWQKVLGVLACMLITIWVVEEFKSAERRQLGSASDTFIAIQDTFKKLGTEGTDDKKKELETVIHENSKVLASGDSFYSEVAPLYDARVALNEGDVAKTKKLLSGYQLEQLFEGKVSSKDADVTSRSISRELAALLYVRAEVFAKELDSARKHLIGFSKSATVGTVEALTLLYRISDTSEQKAKAVAAAQAARTAKPEYGESLEREFRALGVNLS